MQQKSRRLAAVAAAIGTTFVLALSAAPAYAATEMQGPAMQDVATSQQATAQVKGDVRDASGIGSVKSEGLEIVSDGFVGTLQLSALDMGFDERSLQLEKGRVFCAPNGDARLDMKLTNVDGETIVTSFHGRTADERNWTFNGTADFGKGATIEFRDLTFTGLPPTA